MGLADLLVPLLFLGVAGDPLTIYTLPSSSAVLGSAALLKCRFNIGGPINLTALQVHWYFSDQSMAQYDRGKEIFAPRVSISEQELLIGNASLGMEDIQMSDEGQYKCVVRYSAEQQQSETTLSVFAAPRLSIPRRSAGTDTASSFPCHVWGFYPGDVTVTWLRDGRVLTNVTRSAPQRNPDGTFNLTLTYTFTPTTSDSGSIFSCRVSHAALAHSLQEEFPLDVTVPRAGVDHTSAAIGATLGILVAGGAAAAIASYCRRQRRARKGPYQAVETPTEDPAGSREKMRGEDTVLMGNDGVSDAGEGPEQQPLFPAQGQGQSGTQEQDGAQVTASSNSSASRASDVGPRASSWNTQGGPEAEGPSPNMEPLGEMGAQDEERAGAASPQTQPAVQVAFPAQHSTAGEEGETDLSQHSGEVMVPTSQPKAGEQGAPGSQAEAAANMVLDPALEEDAQGESGGLLRPPEVSEISQPESVTAGEEITLSCRMAGHFPGVLCVTWLRRDRGAGAAVRILNSAQYRIEPGAPLTQDGKSFQQENRLSFTPSVQRDQGAEYICRVHHVTLRNQHIEKHTRVLEVTDSTKNKLSKGITSDVSVKDRAEDNAADMGTTSDMSAKEPAGDNTPNKSTTSDVSAKERVGDNTPNKGTTSNVSAKERVGDNTPNKGTTSDVSAKERVGGNTADVGTTSDVSAKEPAGDNTADVSTTSDVSTKEWVGDNTPNKGTTSDVSAKDPVGDNTADVGTTSEVLAKDWVGINTPNKGTTSEVSAKERVGDNTADKGTTGELAEDGPGSATPASNEKGDGHQHHPSV
ncbi:uncharacterized protein LOC119856732 [Dermochelys coriacea]|uniref:uncharacterized protein LOC119856732 n=1 Tax=Dermochelys coriacea TaxID=27794 RepID=UPI001CA87A73|nr:uncharacterized protein LOC119856732 [Dermochelys coriacea]